MSEDKATGAQMAEERRRFFRIDDSVRISLKRVGQEEVEQQLERLDQQLLGSFSLMSSLAAETQQTAAALRRIEGRSPDVAQCIKAIDRKIELLAKALLYEEADIGRHPARPANLSAGGIAVHTREAFEKGALVEIRMLLMPTFTGVLTFGHVVECRAEASEDGEFSHLLRIDFAHIREQDRDAIIRHVLRKQAEWLRRKRHEKERVGTDYGDE